MYKLIGFCLLLSFASLNLFAKKYSLCSPDGKLRVVLHADDGFLTWEVAYTDAAVLQPSRLGLKFQEESEVGLWVKKVRNKESVSLGNLLFIKEVAGKANIVKPN